MHKWDPADYQMSSSAQYNWAMALIERLNLTGEERILDIGCGDGRITAHLASLVPRGRVLGIDLSSDMIGFAAKEHSGNSRIFFQVGDASHLGFKEEFDLIVSFACLHWIEDQLPILRGVRQGLFPGGRFLMQCGGRGNAAKILDITGEIIAEPAWSGYFSGFSFPYHFYGPEEYEPWLMKAGLRPTRVDLVAKDMVHLGQAGLTGIIRNTWLPYTERLPAQMRNDFIREVARRYLEKYPLDREGRAHVQMMRLEVEAKRPV